MPRTAARRCADRIVAASLGTGSRGNPGREESAGGVAIDDGGRAAGFPAAHGRRHRRLRAIARRMRPSAERDRGSPAPARRGVDAARDPPGRGRTRCGRAHRATGGRGAGFPTAHGRRHRRLRASARRRRPAAAQIEDRRRQRDAEWTQRESRLAEAERDVAGRTAQLAAVQQEIERSRQALADQQTLADQQAKLQSQYDAQRAADARRIQRLAEENEQLQRQVQALRGNSPPRRNRPPIRLPKPLPRHRASGRRRRNRAVGRSRRGIARDRSARLPPPRPAPSDAPLYKGVLQCRFEGEPPPIDEPSPWADRLAGAWTHARDAVTRYFAARAAAKQPKPIAPSRPATPATRNAGAVPPSPSQPKPGVKPGQQTGSQAGQPGAGQPGVGSQGPGGRHAAAKPPK